MQESNVLILSERYYNLEEAFLNDSRIGSVKATNTVPSSVEDTLDILVIDGHHLLSLSYPLIQRIRKGSVVFPRILFLDDREQNTDHLSICADIVYPSKAYTHEIVDLAVSTWNRPFPFLSDFDDRKKSACALLDEMHMPETLLGYRFISEGAAILSCTYRHDIPLKTWLYIHIANQCFSKPYLVERNIRTAIEHMFLHGDMNSLQKRFGYTFNAEKGKPTNAETLYMLAEHIKSNIRKLRY